MNSLVVSRERDNISRNLAASVSARLKQHADANKQDFNLTLTHYGLERLLYRLTSNVIADYPCDNALELPDWKRPLPPVNRYVFAMNVVQRYAL